MAAKLGRPKTYDKTKGDSAWARDVQTYLWSNGSVGRYLGGEKIVSSRMTHLNYPLVDRKDPDATLTAFKVM